MVTLSERVENKEMLAKAMPVEEAVKLVTHNSTLAISGFTKSGEPKSFLPSLARHLGKHAPDTKVALFSGASLSDDVENPLAPFISKRGPYMSSSASRKLIHAGQMEMFTCRSLHAILCTAFMETSIWRLSRSLAFVPMGA
jgi:acyl-CoA hydrolase